MFICVVRIIYLCSSVLLELLYLCSSVLLELLDNQELQFDTAINQNHYTAF